MLRRQRGAKRGEFVERLLEQTLRGRDGFKTRGRASVTGNDNLLTGFDLVQKFAQMGLRMREIDREHRFHSVTRKLVII